MNINEPYWTCCSRPVPYCLHVATGDEWRMDAEERIMNIHTEVVCGSGHSRRVPRGCNCWGVCIVPRHVWGNMVHPFSNINSQFGVIWFPTEFASKFFIWVKCRLFEGIRL